MNKYLINNRFYLGQTPKEAIAKFLSEQDKPMNFKCVFHSRINTLPRIAPVPTIGLKGAELIGSSFSLRRRLQAVV